MRTISKTETEVFRDVLEFGRALENNWTPDTKYVLNDVVRPTLNKQYQYKLTAIESSAAYGLSGKREPTWPRVAGNTKVSGPLTWTCEVAGDGSTDSIASVNSVVPAGILVTAPSIQGTEVVYLVSGGTAGQVYEISIEITTTAGRVIEVKIQVTITSE